MPVTWSKPSAFSINISDARIQAVRAAVQTFDFADFDANILSTQISEDDFSLGFPPSIAKQLVERLKNGYDWREYEKVMNGFGTHYMVEVDGIPGEPEPMNVHVVERRSKRDNAIPIVLNHGWPGSFFESVLLPFDDPSLSKARCQRFYKLAPLLTDPENPDDQAFHCIIPSLPGYTFSSPPKARGWNIYKVAATIDAVVQALGYRTYLAQGGDWGWATSSCLASEYPERCRGVHLNLIPPHRTPTEQQKATMSADELRGLEADNEYSMSGSAYFQMNKTVPYTVGLVLASSPLAALFYIGEKLYRWPAPDSLLSIDEVLTSALLYIYTGSLTSSLWLYVAPTVSDYLQKKIEVPSAFSGGRVDLLWAPKSLVEEQYTKLVWWRVLKEGGHFLALEKPELLAKEIREFGVNFETQKSLKA
ncbi:hypothetical protein GYMLUDRAFT_397159 [Collybiopsis luxurians FD-317 M1]|uniref:Epoxide hydrolase N-terminal domain-containing protein n=1 Tax=Collybiopsis luxurians FD-317 M1 TaxID=944289 RepID=A0A0D0C903_9AGAR|nr:hypothetical protein GYMLUDRAFT_397159 [Collybiopsis luxurians FD-317 M1]